MLDNIELVLAAQQQPGYLDLSMASPRGGDFYPTTRLKHILHKLSREQPTLATDYSYPPGAQSLREQVARRALAWGVALAADDIVTTNGCTEALQLALRTVCKHGDTIGLESPTYFLLLPLLKSLGLNVIEIPTHPTTRLSLEGARAAAGRKTAAGHCGDAHRAQPAGGHHAAGEQEKVGRTGECAPRAAD